MTERPPVARAVTNINWLQVQAGYLGQIRVITDEYRCPLVIAGDIFDKWNSSAALINFAISEFFKFRFDRYAIPGQHDLPWHGMSEIRKSAYWTLVESGAIINLEWQLPLNISGLTLHGFPWDTEIIPINFVGGYNSKSINLAVVHKYIWDKDAKFPGADEELYVGNSYYQAALGGFDAAVFGDNHKGFLRESTHPSYPHVLNSGGLIRRKIDEQDYRPSVGLLMVEVRKKIRKVTIERHYLDTSADQFIHTDEPELASHPKLAKFLEELEQVRDTTINFVEAVRQFMQSSKQDARTKMFVIEAMESSKKGKS